jgi:hypothetical protein
MEKYFHFSNTSILLWRMGGINSVKQAHWNKKVLKAPVMGDGEPELVLLHQPPVKRGLWCFPYGFHDYFFSWRQWELRLPKRFQKEALEKMKWDEMSNEEAEAFHAEKAHALKKIQLANPPKKFLYSAGFYSHISRHNQVNYDDWYFWDNPKEWARTANKHIFVTERYNDTVFTASYSADHLELFIPNY